MPNMRVYAAGLSMAVLVAGCQKAQPPITGKWQTNTNVPGASISMTREFRADGTETMTSGIPNGPGYQAKYSVHGNQLTETVTQMTLDGHTVGTSGAPPGGPQGITETYAVDGDKLTITSNSGVTQTFTRVQGQ